MLELGEWYWYSIGATVKFFKLTYITKKGSPMETYHSSYYIDNKGNIKESANTHRYITSKAHLEYIRHITITDILNYYLEGEEPPIWA